MGDRVFQTVGLLLIAKMRLTLPAFERRPLKVAYYIPV